MKTKGIRILDKVKGVVSVTLSDILKELPQDNTVKWSILYLEATGIPQEGAFIEGFEKKINGSLNGLNITWMELNHLAPKFSQIKDIILIGSKDGNLLRRYCRDQEMYETCDYMINMFDCDFWEIFSKDEAWINHLATKFKKVEFLESDFQDHLQKWSKPQE